MTGEVKLVTIEPANEDEITNTEAVMGGEDWEMWLDLLQKESLLSENAITLAYSYIGPELTFPIYKNGTIGRAKDHLQKTADKLNEKLKSINGKAFISVNKALVTQASAAIPVVPLYISLLYKLMKEQGTHEGCIEQIYRLLVKNVYSNTETLTDEKGRVRIDDLEMQNDIQNKVIELWSQVDSNNIDELSDIQGYRDEFFRLFGFGIMGIDYKADTNSDIKIPSIEAEDQ